MIISLYKSGDTVPYCIIAADSITENQSDIVVVRGDAVTIFVDYEYYTVFDAGEEEAFNVMDGVQSKINSSL